MNRSGHVDTFARDNLPPPEQWPEFLFELPELQFAPRLNCAAELLDRAIERGWGARDCVLGDGVHWSYAELLAQANRIAPLATMMCAPNFSACAYARPVRSSPEMPVGKPR